MRDIIWILGGIVLMLLAAVVWVLLLLDFAVVPMVALAGDVRLGAKRARQEVQVARRRDLIEFWLS